MAGGSDCHSSFLAGPLDPFKEKLIPLIFLKIQTWPEKENFLPDHFRHRAVQPRADAQQCDAVALLQPAHLAQLGQHDRHRGRADVAVLAEDGQDLLRVDAHRSEAHPSELQSLMRISYA